MTTTRITIEQPAVDARGLSGVDLARVALHHARAAAKKRGGRGPRAPHRRRARAVQRDGREPCGFATVLQGLMADRAWELPVASGTVLDRWPDIAAAIAPQLADHVVAVVFHPETGQLDLRPDSPAYATQLRLLNACIIAAANDAAGTQTVRSIRVLAAGAVPQEHMVESAPVAPATSQAPVKTRETASPGYHQALAAHRSATPAQRIDPAIAEAMERQTKAMRELSRRAFPEHDVAPDSAPTLIVAARAQRQRRTVAVEAAALRRARAERAGREAGKAPVVSGLRSLRSTA
ncbi:DciA family protein [Streptomyces sp. NPDC021100]|uniref:DciA family protein n=1 Tax=Streptomyces sp. NPDC021100 TaxID=3365114 RepID=UPI00379B8E79